MVFWAAWVSVGQRGVIFAVSAELVAALAKDFAVVVEAEHQLVVRAVLVGDELAQRVLVAAARFFVVFDQALVLAHDVAQDAPGEQAEDDECGDEKPAVALGGAVVGEFEEIVHIDVASVISKWKIVISSQVRVWARGDARPPGSFQATAPPQRGST